MKICLPDEVLKMISEDKQSFISPYNKGHKLFVIPKLHTQQQTIFFKLI